VTKRTAIKVNGFRKKLFENSSSKQVIRKRIQSIVIQVYL